MSILLVEVQQSRLDRDWPDDKQAITKVSKRHIKFVYIGANVSDHF